MHNTVQVLLRLVPIVASKLKILSHIHNKSMGALVTKIVERMWELEPKTEDTAIHNLVNKYVKANLKSYVNKALES